VAQLASERRTPRLTLRRWELSDLDDLAPIYASEDVARYLYWSVRDRAETLAKLKSCIMRPVEVVDENVLPVAAVLNESGRVVGDFILRWTNDEHRQGEIGGSLHPDYHGRGLAVEVYRELLAIGFEQFSLHRIVGRCDARNVASIRALEKVGLVREAHLVENEFVKGEWTDEVVLAIRRSQWQARGVPDEVEAERPR
jgi:RimJ/RimL family protein N-acetyltransferase